ncbi:nucleotidyltransferase family protein [Synechococcus sp. PCC 7336]|uniref:nucleotidyltransferase family protein n=1 Tax=Synechococcus sp. PCC 7336 TaxID=195250 RepID=UPI000347B274|nr:nucleotidyltransferase family protein [Synechococcus sp. PCC 7336]
MKTLTEIRDWLIRHRDGLRDEFHVSQLGVFGSYARGEQTEASDLDLLVEFSRTPSLLTFVRLEDYLSDRLQVKVDLVHRAGLKPRLRERIQQEAIDL